MSGRTEARVAHLHLMVHNGRMVDIVTGDAGCVHAWLGEWCEVMLTPAFVDYRCLTHRRPTIVPNPPRGDVHGADDLAACFRAFEFARVVGRSGIVNRQLRRLPAYGIHSAFRDTYRDALEQAIAGGLTPTTFGTQALVRRAASNALADMMQSLSCCCASPSLPSTHKQNASFT